MPLKEPDLKDTDTYKKASRMDLPKVAAGNAKFFIYKDVELPHTSGKKQKYPAFLALVDDNGIRKVLTGKKLICKGICGMKEEKIAFEPATGKVPYKQLKVSVPLLLGKMVWIPAGMEDDAGDGEAEEAGQVGPAADGSMPAPSAALSQASPAAPQAAAASAQAQPAPTAPLSAIWGKLVKDVQAYAAAHPERKEALFREMSVIAELLKANKAGEAKPRMDRVQALLDGPPAATPAGPSANAAQVAARWSALVKQMQAVVAAQPEKKAELVRASAGIGDLIRAGKLDLATKLMDGVDAMLRGTASSDTASKVNATGQAEWEKRFAEIEPRYLAVLKTQPANASELRAAMSSANALAEKRDFAGATGTLGRLESLLGAAKTLGKETDVIPEGIVKQTVEQLENASSRWRQAHFKSVEGLESLMKTLRANMDPDLHDIADKVDRLTKGIPSEIEASLAQLSSAVQARNAGEAAKWAKQVKAAVETCSSYLDKNLPDIERCEENPFELPVTIQKPLRETLADIRAALPDLQLGAA
jgi:hypothetical protein